MRTFILAAATIAALSGTAHANPAAIAAATAIQGQQQSQFAGQEASNSNSTHNDSTTIGAALGQAPTAISATSKCGKGTKFFFGLLEWTDFSDKCFDREMAMIAASQYNNWELANQWTGRADNE